MSSSNPEHDVPSGLPRAEATRKPEAENVLWDFTPQVRLLSAIGFFLRM
jgi:hypothetical protein